MSVAVIRRAPTAHDLQRLRRAARNAVEEMLVAKGAQGFDVMEQRYIAAIYDAVVAGEIKPKPPRRRKGEV